MNLIDRLIAPIAPAWALRRAQSRLALRAYYEAAEAKRTKKRRIDRSDANARNLRSVEQLRIEARHLDENHDLARGVLNTMVNGIVGTGIRPEPQIRLADGSLARELNSLLERLWADWIKIPEVTWTHGYYQVQRLVCRGWLRDGEVFAQLLQGTVGGLDHGTEVPFSLELLEPDHCPVDYDTGGAIQGVIRNAWGRPRQYVLYKFHPGASTTDSAIKIVGAENIAHLKSVDRLNQIRGVSIFASVINRLDDIKEIDESERVASRVAAAMAAFIKKGSPENYQAPENGQDYRHMEFVPGMIFDDLQPGEEVGSIGSNRPNNALIPFRQDQMRAVAAGIGGTYSSFAKDYNGTYSAQRQELVESRVAYEALTDIFIDQFAQIVWDRFVNAAMVARLIPIAGVDLTTLYDATHSRPAMPWIDPEKEANANILMQGAGYKSKSTIIRERGGNPAQVRAEIIRDREEDEAAGIAPAGESEQQSGDTA